MSTENVSAPSMGRATASWVFPILAWVSQFLFVTIARSSPGVRQLAIVVMVVQIGLLAGGLYLGAHIVKLKRTTIPPAVWWSGLLGVILSAGSILFIVVTGIITGLSL